jgi:hypothetical protein
LRARADIEIGHSRKLCGDARGLGENRWWKRRQRLRNNTATKVAEETLFRRQKFAASGSMAFARLREIPSPYGKQMDTELLRTSTASLSPNLSQKF